MKRMIIGVTASLAWLMTVGAAAATPTEAVPLGQDDFIHADGPVLRNAADEVVNLRGTNLGGWLAMEDWMSPLGEFALDRTGWSATGSGGSAANAVDGSGTSLWSSGQDQAGGEWLQLDLGAATVFNRLSLNSTTAPGQFPRSLEVEVSRDGQTWVSVAEAPGVDGVTTVKFAPQIASYVRVSQTGSAAAPWSVGEINLFVDPVLHNGAHTATASSSAVGTSPSAMLDGDASTVWQSGVAQEPGQTVTIDLGRNVSMDSVLFDAGPDTANDYPRTWDVYVSWDNVNFTKVASGYGGGRIIEANFHGSKEGRYLRIESNGTSSQWWSIAEIAIASGTSVDRGGWTVSTSTGGAATDLIDGSVGTQWTTGTNQVPGQAIEVDMGALVTLNNITTDTAKNTTWEADWPRGYVLELSRNGTDWTTVAEGAGTVKATTIGFPAQAARYFRLTQTASADRWWSIGELTAGLYDDDYSLNLSMADRFGRQTAQTIIDAHHDTWITESDLDIIAATGLNTIRLPISWMTFLNLDGTWKTDPWEKIDWLIAEARERGMYTLLDLHTVPGGGCPWGSCGRIGPNPNGFWGSQIYQDWTVGIWEEIAARYEGNPAVAGYDLINEPLISYGEGADDVKQKSDFYDRLYDAVRAIDPDHLIVIAAFFGEDSIASPATYGWQNVMYEYHPYDMPGSKDWSAQDRLVTEQLTELPDRLADHGVPVLFGEYSLYYNDDVWSRFMAGLNAQDQSWMNWTYKVRGSAAEGFAYWGLYYGNPNPVPVINSDALATFIAKIGRFDTSEFTRNERFVATLSRYADGRDTYQPVVIDHSGWGAQASSSASWAPPLAGIDGVNGSGWSSGQAMAGGEWYRIDMGAEHTVSMVTLETPATAVWDYPRGFDLEVSTDGQSWTTAATGIAYGWKRPISIDPTRARYIRVTQTGVAPQWWSIDEVTVYSSY